MMSLGRRGMRSAVEVEVAKSFWKRPHRPECVERLFKRALWAMRAMDILSLLCITLCAYARHFISLVEIDRWFVCRYNHTLGYRLLHAKHRPRLSGTPGTIA